MRGMPRHSKRRATRPHDCAPLALFFLAAEAKRRGSPAHHLLEFSSVKGVLRFAAVPIGTIALAILVAALRRDSAPETPGAVVQKFVRHVSAERYAKATPLLASELEMAATPETLSAWEREAESGLGKVRGVRGETNWISGEEAEATAILRAERRERRLRFSLEREDGAWAITRLDGFWGNAPAAAGSARIRESWRNRPAPARRRR